MRRILVALGVLAVALVLLSISHDSAPAKAANDVHDYTNVTIDSGCLLVPEGTAGATLIAHTGTPNLGSGGYGVWPYDDGWTAGQVMPTAEDHANYFDRNWYQIYYPGTATFDLGAPSDKVYIALSQDHGPYPEEAIDYRLAVSNFANGPYTTLPTDTPITMFRRGWSSAGETVPCVGPFTGDHPVQEEGNGRWTDVSNDDYSVQWDLPGSYRYVRITAISDTAPYNEPEIDAVMGIEMEAAGCTPGYWKQPQHFDSWTPPYDPPDKFSDVFGKLITVRAGGKNTITDPTLLEALQANGGGINALVRHGVSALLNGATPGVSYAFSPPEVIAMVQDAIDSGDYETTKNLLAAENERGCPLN